MKKKIVLVMAIIAVLFMGNGVSAQDSGWWAGGQLGFWHNNNDGIKTNSFKILPEVGYDLNSNWTLAASVGYSNRSVKIDDVKTSDDLFMISPYARYKFCTVNIVTFFVDGCVGVAFGDNDGYQIGLSPGVAVKLSKNLSVVTSVGFLGWQKGAYHANGGKGFGLDFSGANLTFGAYYSF